MSLIGAQLLYDEANSDISPTPIDWIESEEAIVRKYIDLL